MAKQGPRLLSLDGGGTRVLTTLYILREVMSTVIAGNGSKIRPCEYFDLIGGSGLNGLCALLFIRFSYTIDQAIDFFQNLSQKLDDIENFRIKILRGDVIEEAEDWRKCANRSQEPAEQLEELRQGTVQDCWSDAIKSNITDGLERYLYMENGEFKFMYPLAKVDAGRSKAFVVNSESQGYGDNGGFSHDRQYNVPILHRTYDCRHGRTSYTLYAVGLGTVASPGIMKPGVIFPDFLATGEHTVHNPTRLILEESNKLWPGLCVSALLSIGTGTFELTNSLSESIISGTASACLKICEENEQLADEIKKFIVPHDKQLASAYFRLNYLTPTPFFEYSVRKRIQDDVRSWMADAEVATKCAYAAEILKMETFPSTPEDLIALASLATVLHTLAIAGYRHESSIINDVITNYILYEAAAADDGSFRKLKLAAEAEQIGSRIHGMCEAYKGEFTVANLADLRSEAAVLNGLMAFGDHAREEARHSSGELQTPSDYAAGAYYFLTVLRRSDPSELNTSRSRKLFRQLSSLLNMSAEINQYSNKKIEELLELATLAALCEAGSVQYLLGVKGLLYNGSLIRRVCNVLQKTSTEGVSLSIIEQIANMLALSITANNWSPHRDDAIINLLSAGSTAAREHSWGLLNLALERYNAEKHTNSDSVDNSEVFSVCENYLQSRATMWTKDPEILMMSVKKGWFGLLWKYIRRENLTNNSQTSFDIPESAVIAAFHQASQAGFPYIMKTLIDGLGMEYSKSLINKPNNRGQTPLHLACMHRAPKEVFKLLFVLGSNVNAQCQLGCTPLHYCFPSQKRLPSVYKDITNIVSDHSLPTTAPLNLPHILGMDKKPKPIDPVVYDFRVIICQLLSYKANTCVQDHEGMTPLHRAAKEDWSDNFDVFFLHDHGDAERSQRTCLKLVDDAGLTVLDYARMSRISDFDSSTSGEDIITMEMKKRAIEIPPKPSQNLRPPGTEYVNLIPLAIPDPQFLDSGVNNSSTSTAVSEHPKKPTTNTQNQIPINFPPPIVYIDPEFSETPNTNSQARNDNHIRSSSWTSTSASYSIAESNRLQAKEEAPRPGSKGSWTSRHRPSSSYSSNSQNNPITQSNTQYNLKDTEQKSKSKFLGKWMKGL